MKRSISFISIITFLLLLLIISYSDSYNFIPSLSVFATKTDSSSTSTENPSDKSSTSKEEKNDNSGSNAVALLARVINAEARGETYLGQVAVGAVVMNRVKSSEFPNTIAGVIYQKGQFTSVTDGQFDKSFEKNTTVNKAAEDAYNGSDPTNGAIYFYNPKTTKSQWLFTRTTTKVIGSHTFAK